ncbi:MAG: hypothetical protein P8X60_04490, partial [Robiginitalea sp.]
TDFAITGEAMATNLYGWIRSMEENGLFSEDVRVIAFTSECTRIRIFPLLPNIDWISVIISARACGFMASF